MTHAQLELYMILRIEKEKMYKRTSAFINNIFLKAFVQISKGPVEGVMRQVAA